MDLKEAVNKGKEWQRMLSSKHYKTLTLALETLVAHAEKAEPNRFSLEELEQHAKKAANPGCTVLDCPHCLETADLLHKLRVEGGMIVKDVPTGAFVPQPTYEIAKTNALMLLTSLLSGAT